LTDIADATVGEFRNVVTESAITVFHLPVLVQIRWAKWSLERVRVKAGRGEAGRPLEHGDVLAHQLSHFVNTLHQFVMDRLLHGAWLELQQVCRPGLICCGHFCDKLCLANVP